MYLISLQLSKDIKKALVLEYFIGEGYGQILLLLSVTAASSVKLQYVYH